MSLYLPDKHVCSVLCEEIRIDWGISKSQHTLLLSRSSADGRHRFLVPGYGDLIFLEEWLVPHKDLYKNEQKT